LATLTCPECGSHKLRRSRTRGLKEKFLKIFGLRAFRCQVETCHWRGLLNPDPLGEKLRGFIKDNFKFLLIMAGVALVILLFFLLTAWLISSC
jgi:hypothetical protein